MKLIVCILLLAIVAFAQPYEPVLLYDEVFASISELSMLGDQNGDGFDDVLIGIPDEGQSWDGFGHLRIIYGGENDPFETLDFGFMNRDTSQHAYAPYWSAGPSTCGDYNGDGYIDIMVQSTTTSFNSRMFYAHGGPISFDTLWDWYSDNTIVRYRSLGGVGDYDGDGKMDYLRRSTVGFTDHFDFYSGSWPNLSEEPTWTYYVSVDPGHVFTGWFGRLQGQGDINGDGFADFAFPMWYVLQEPPHYNPLQRHGIWLGGPDAGMEPAYLFEYPIPGEWIGDWQPLADVNGDGIDDLIAKRQQWTQTSFQLQEIQIYYGGDPLDLDQHDANLYVPDGWSLSDLNTERVSRLGDINDDGFEDFAFYWLGDVSEGYILVYLGGDPPSGDVAFLMGPLWNGTRPGYYMSSAGDFNGDGIDDFAVITSALEEGARIAVIAGDPGFGLAAPEGPPTIAKDFHFGSPYPNPFNSSVSIPLELSKPQLVGICIYNILGQQVYNFGRRLMLNGKHELKWEGVTNQGTALASGVYVVQARTAGEVASVIVELVR